MPNKRRILLGISVVALASACTTTGPSIPEKTATATLPPMDAPVYKMGQQVVYTNLLTNSQESWTVTDIAEDGTLSATMTTGCEWKSSQVWFNGVGEWNNCGSGDWSAAKTTPLTTGESLWPLQDGAKSKYRFKTTNKVGKSNIHNRTCKVSTTNIETSVGALDAYKVLCVDKNPDGKINNVRTWYFNPDHGELQFSRWNQSGGMRTHHKRL